MIKFLGGLVIFWLFSSAIAWLLSWGFGAPFTWQSVTTTWAILLMALFWKIFTKDLNR